jgi:hypothetical protein
MEEFDQNIIRKIKKIRLLAVILFIQIIAMIFILFINNAGAISDYDQVFQTTEYGYNYRDGNSCTQLTYQDNEFIDFVLQDTNLSQTIRDEIQYAIDNGTVIITQRRPDSNMTTRWLELGYSSTPIQLQWTTTSVTAQTQNMIKYAYNTSCSNVPSVNANFLLTVSNTSTGTGRIYNHKIYGSIDANLPTGYEGLVPTPATTSNPPITGTIYDDLINPPDEIYLSNTDDDTCQTDTLITNYYSIIEDLIENGGYSSFADDWQHWKDAVADPDNQFWGMRLNTQSSAVGGTSGSLSGGSAITFYSGIATGPAVFSQVTDGVILSMPTSINDTWYFSLYAPTNSPDCDEFRLLFPDTTNTSIELYRYTETTAGFWTNNQSIFVAGDYTVTYPEGYLGNSVNNTYTPPPDPDPPPDNIEQLTYYGWYFNIYDKTVEFTNTDPFIYMNDCTQRFKTTFEVFDNQNNSIYQQSTPVTFPTWTATEYGTYRVILTLVDSSDETCAEPHPSTLDPPYDITFIIDGSNQYFALDQTNLCATDGSNVCSVISLTSREDCSVYSFTTDPFGFVSCTIRNWFTDFQAFIINLIVPKQQYLKDKAFELKEHIIGNNSIVNQPLVFYTQVTESITQTQDCNVDVNGIFSANTTIDMCTLETKWPAFWTFATTVFRMGIVMLALVFMTKTYYNIWKVAV